MEVTDLIEEFFESPAYAVVGASNDMSKFGAKVFAAYREQGLKVYPVNPNEKEIQGKKCYARLTDVPGNVLSCSVITPPSVTEDVVEDAAAKGVHILWIQPGAENTRVVERAEELGMSVITGGACILVTFRTRKPA